MKKWTEIMKNLTMLSQLGISFITPTLMCLAICYRLNNSFQIGTWIYLIGFFFGLGSSFMVAYKLYLSIMNKEKKDDRKKTINFNEHE